MSPKPVIPGKPFARKWPREMEEAACKAALDELLSAREVHEALLEGRLKGWEGSADVPIGTIGQWAHRARQKHGIETTSRRVNAAEQSLARTTDRLAALLEREVNKVVTRRNKNQAFKAKDELEQLAKAAKEIAGLSKIVRDIKRPAKTPAQQKGHNGRPVTRVNGVPGPGKSFLEGLGD